MGDLTESNAGTAECTAQTVNVEQLLAYIPKGHLLAFNMPHFVKYLDRDVFHEFLTGRRVTYQQLLNNALRLAAWLTQHCPRTQTNDFIQLFADNSPEWMTCMYAGLLAGYATASASPHWTAERFAAYVERVEAAVFFTDAQSLNESTPEQLSALQQSQSIQHVILIDDKPLNQNFSNSLKKPMTRLSSIFEQYADSQAALDVLTAAKAATFNEEKFGSDIGKQICCLIPSSGTTGTPKAIVMSHFSQIERVNTKIADLPKLFNVSMDVAPNPHAILIMQMNNFVSVYQHLTYYVAPPRMITHVLFPAIHFSRDTFARAIQQFKPTFQFATAPLLIQTFFDSEFIKKYDTSSVLGMVTGASPLKPRIQQRLCDMNEWACVCQAYAAGEMNLILFSLEPLFSEEIARKKCGSVGKPIPGDKFELKFMQVLGPSQTTGEGSKYGQELTKPNERGELWVRPTSRPSMMFDGYYKLPKQTAQVITSDGWYRTGDMMYVDDDGWYWHVDRINELFWLDNGDKWASPAELEEILLLQNNDVADVALIRNSSSKLLELFLVPRHVERVLGNAEEENQLAAKLCQVYNGEVEDTRLHLAQERIHMVDTLPRNNSKIMRSVLREQSNCSRTKA